MNPKTISFCQGKGSLSHNNRTFKTKNVDSSKSQNNVTFVNIPLAKAYDMCFSDAVKRYNDRQTRPDRRIEKSYYKYLFSQPPGNSVVTAPNKKKNFYEIVIQIGDRNDTGTDTSDGNLASDCLKNYINGFQHRNTNFFMFNAVLHLDESTPHLHIDFIPIGHYSRGMDTQNGMAQALKEMSFGNEKNAISKWRMREYSILKDICAEHGIEVSQPRKSRGYSFSVNEYKEHMEQLESLNKEIDEKSKKLYTLRNIEDIFSSNEIECKKLPFGKCAISEDDYVRLNTFNQSLLLKEHELSKREKIIAEKENVYSDNLNKAVKTLEENKKLKAKIEKSENEYHILLNQFLQKKQIWDELKEQLAKSEEQKKKEKKKADDAVNFIMQIVMLSNKLLKKTDDGYDDLCDYATTRQKQIAETIRYMARRFVSYIGYDEASNELFMNAGFTKNTLVAFKQISENDEGEIKYYDR